jgi:hypothetical protein
MSEEFKDIDTDYSSQEISDAVDSESNLVPKDATATTSFKLLLATYLAGFVVSVLVAKGYLVSKDAELVQGLLQMTILGIAAWITNTFVNGRNKVSLVKAETEQKLALYAMQSPISGIAVQREGMTTDELKTLAKFVSEEIRGDLNGYPNSQT